MKTLLLLTSACLTISSQAAVMQVDFGVTSRETPGWNNFSSYAEGSRITLVDTTGGGTGITLMLLGGDVNPLDDIDSVYIAPTSPPAPFTLDTVVRDGVFTTGLRTLTLSNLTIGETYNITLYAYVARDGSRGTRIAIPGAESQVIEPARIGGSTSGQTATFTGLVPDGSGSIVISLSSSVGSNWILNAMQVQSVPEPAAALLCGAGLAPLLLRRKRA